MKIYRAYYDSRNFTFEAYSKSEKTARAKCLEGLHKHGEQYKLDPDWYLYDGRDDIYTQEIDLDTFYRDRDTI